MESSDDKKPARGSIFEHIDHDMSMDSLLLVPEKVSSEPMAATATTDESHIEQAPGKIEGQLETQVRETAELVTEAGLAAALSSLDDACNMQQPNGSGAGVYESELLRGSQSCLSPTKVASDDERFSRECTTQLEECARVHQAPSTNPDVETETEGKSSRLCCEGANEKVDEEKVVQVEEDKQDQEEKPDKGLYIDEKEKDECQEKEPQPQQQQQQQQQQQESPKASRLQELYEEKVVGEEEIQSTHTQERQQQQQQPHIVGEQIKEVKFPEEPYISTEIIEPEREDSIAQLLFESFDKPPSPPPSPQHLHHDDHQQQPFIQELQQQQQQQIEEAQVEVEEPHHTPTPDIQTLHGYSGAPQAEEEREFVEDIQIVPTTTQASFLHEAYQTFQTAAGNSILEEDLNKQAETMEFAKNYSDDLLGQCDPLHQNDQTQAPSADLADFELPPYSGSSSGSELAASKSSPTIERKSLTTSEMAPLAQQASSSQISAAPPSLTAFKDLLMSNYSQVSHIFHWRRPIESGVVFGTGFTLIVTLTFFSIISVFAYSALGLILASGMIRLYKAVMKALKKPTETPFDNIWNKILGMNVTMSHEKMHELVDRSLGNFNSSVVYLKQVLLVEDKIATLKFGLFLYSLTYIGSWFNGMTLITIAYLGLFSVPVAYEMNKTRVDEYLALVEKQVSSTLSMVSKKATSIAFGQSASPTTSGSKKQN